MKDFNNLIKQVEQAVMDENSELIENESEYQLCQKTKASRLKSLLDLDFDLYFSYFGSSLRITITPDGQGATVFDRQKGIDFFYEELDTFIKDDCGVIFIFNINKDQFIKEKFTAHQNSKTSIIRIFKSKDTFTVYLKDNSIFYLQNRLFKEEKRLIVILPDLNCSSNNDLVYIIGNDCFQDIKKIYTQEIDNGILEKLRGKVQLREKEVGWKDDITFITPDYFYFYDLQETNLRSIFYTKLVESVLIFLANGVKKEDDSYILQFNGYKCNKVLLQENVNLESLSDLNYICTYDLYKWVYNSNFLDKIMIVRNIISKYLRENEKLNYCGFLDNVADIFNASKANYQIFFQSKIDNFFEDRKKIAQYTFDKTKEIEKEINNLTDSMTKNVITAVGVVLAAIIANSTKNPQGVKGIKVAILAYLFYLFISIIYNLITPLISMIQQYKSNSHLIKYYTNFVPEEEIKQVQGNVLVNKLFFFWGYWLLSLILMIALVAISIYSISHLEEFLNLI